MNEEDIEVEYWTREEVLLVFEKFAKTLKIEFSEFVRRLKSKELDSGDWAEAYGLFALIDGENTL